MVAKRPKIGTTLKVARIQAGLDQEQLRDRVRAFGPPIDKTNLQTISNIERDRQFPSPELLAAICSVLGIRSLPITETDSRDTNNVLEAPPENRLDSSSSNPARDSADQRRSADLSAALAPVTSPVSPSDDDPLTEDEKAMLTPSEQHVIRQMRRASTSDREKIVGVVDAITGHAEERAKGSTGTFDSQPARFRTR